MSLITRCPACDTMFKVVPDQLRISEGWVRCGQCGEIFNASQNLVAPPPAPPAASPATVAPPIAPSVPRDADPTAPPRKAPPPVAAVTSAPDATPRQFEQKVWDLNPAPDEPGPEDARAPAFTPMEPTWSDPLPAPPQAPEPEPAAGPVVPADPPAPAAAPLAPDTRHAEDTGRVPPDDDGTPAVSFLRPDDHDSVWRRRSVRLVLAAVAALLCGLLLVQVMVQERNRIVLLEPATRPVVLALCQLAGCTIGPLRQIESVVIDSSSFGRLRGEGYRLGFSLRNQAPIDIAMPAIELSLTDTQDQALIRRVILPAEFGAPGDVLAAGADWSGALALNIRADATAERIAGYRLLAFYP